MRNIKTNEWSNKIVSFIDLAGHEKYLKTTIEDDGALQFGKIKIKFLFR